MPSLPNEDQPAAAIDRWTGVALGVLASLRLAIGLLVLLAVVLAAATFIERNEGAGYAQWYVYHSSWFAGLLGLLAANIVAAAAVRYPWKGRHVGFLIAHAGILVLMFGAMLTFYGKLEGRLELTEGGDAADHFVLSDHHQLEVRWQDVQGGKTRPPAAFGFKPGTVDWPEGKTFDLGEKSGVHLRVTKYICRSRVEQDWVADESHEGPPALTLAVAGGDPAAVETRRLIAGPFGSAEQIGPAQFEFYRLRAATMLDDFLKPPAAGEMDASGLLSIHFDGKMQRIPVGPNLGKKIALGDGKVSVELVEYLPNARPGAAKPGAVVNFVSEGSEPKNPLLELRIHVDGKAEPLRQIAFANDPFRSFDGMHGRSYPVLFWYHHPATEAAPGAQFAQAPDGKLYCRVGSDGKYRPRGAVREGDTIDLAGTAAVKIVQHLPSARPKYSFHSVPYAKDKGGKLPPAVRLEVTAGDETQEVWLRYGDQRHGAVAIDTPEGQLAVALGDYHYPLGFSLRLLALNREFDPGGAGEPVISSTIRLVDKSQETDEEREIGLNRPTEQGRFRFFQLGTANSADGRPASVLGVTTDPGHWPKYAGSAMLCIGAAFMFFRKAPFGRAGAAAVFLATMCVAAPHAEAADWRQWRSLPVLDRGRQKPLDTMARETLRSITGRSSVVDPESGETLDATAAYLTMLFDWQADKPATGADKSPHGAMGKSPHGAMGMGPHGGAGMSPHGAGMMAAPTSYFRLHEPDKWDRAPLILVDSAELRKALDMQPGQRHIAARELSEAGIQDLPSQQRLFRQMCAGLDEEDDDARAKHETSIVETARRLETYQDLRLGRGLAVTPVPDSEVGAWASVGSLLRVALTDRTDPTGLLREVKEKYEAVRAAYREGADADFDAASADFLAAVREAGPELGNYPSTDVIDLEVAYNRWPPFRIAWILTALAGAFAAVNLGVRKKLLGWSTLAAFLAALASMLAGFAVRTIITGHAPLTNMYETVVFVAFAAVAMGLVCQAVYRQPVIPLVAAVIATLLLVAADNGSGTLSPDMHPLKPILRSSFWLIVHVKVIMLSYAAFALALGLGNVTLGFYFTGSPDRSALAALSKFTYRTLQAGVFLLAAGTITGAMWADYAWGRFWGWDPKEVWALVSLLAYTAVLHLRYVGWLGHRSLAALSVLCFSLIVATWFFVNFIGGLHAYGSSGAGAIPYILGGLAIQALYVGIALLRSTATSSAA